MKRTILMLLSVIFCVSVANADDKPITLDRLPKASKSFIDTYFPNVGVVLATIDDDFIRPEYNIVLENGVMIQFENNGSLDKIEAVKGQIPSEIIPVQIRTYVKAHYPAAVIQEYEVGRKTYEVKLSNRMELKFNSNFNIIEIDD